MVSSLSIPEAILENMAWSFKEVVPPTPLELIKAVAKYNMEIKQLFDERDLTARAPFAYVDVVYDCFEVVPVKLSNEDKLVKIRKTIRVTGNTLTYADIFWQIHKGVHECLSRQDHHYFEGLFLIADPKNGRAPTYEMYLGS